MKRCPRCFETYDESERFCELDGQPLLADPTLTAPTGSNIESLSTSAAPKPDVQSSQQREVWFVGTAGVVLGIVVCVGGYLAYGLWNEDSGFKETSAPAFAAQSRDEIPPTRQQAPRVAPTVAPEEAVTPEPEASPEPAQASTEESKAVVARVNQGPVSTGQRKKDADESVQTIIQMNDGTSVEVDAAWEDGQGVWYRRGGMVAFVESQRVKAITGRAAQKPASSSTQ